MQSRHRLVQTQHVRPQAARGSAARCSCTALRRRLHPYHGSAGTRASASLVAVGSFVVASALLKAFNSQAKFSFRHRGHRTGVHTGANSTPLEGPWTPSETRHTLESHTDTHSHSQNHFTHQGGSRTGAVVWKSNSQVLLPVKRHRAGPGGAGTHTHDLPVLYCTVSGRHTKSVCVNVKVCHCVMLVYSSNNTQNH